VSKTAARSVESVSAGLRELLRSRRAQLSLGEIVDRFEGRGGLGPVLFVLALPILLPLPPGASMVLSLPLLVVTPQIVVGRAQLWLPRWLAKRTLERKAFAKLARRLLPPLERIEALGKPRLSFLTGTIGTRFIGVAATVIALILVLPIPFANLLPALALGLLALGLTRKDGLMVLGGYGFLGLALSVIGLGAHSLVVVMHHLAPWSDRISTRAV
jgi:hypothetical protein